MIKEDLKVGDVIYFPKHDDGYFLYIILSQKQTEYMTEYMIIVNLLEPEHKPEEWGAYIRNNAILVSPLMKTVILKAGLIK